MPDLRTSAALPCRLGLALAFVGVAVVAAGAADTVSPSDGGLFSPRAFEEVETGSELLYHYARWVEPEHPQVHPLEGRAVLTLAESADGVREARLQLTVEGDDRSLPPFPASAGHPVLLVFLEGTVSGMARVTGGNPDYIRIRLREALWLDAETRSVDVAFAGRATQGQELTVQPFAQDPNRDRMGGFADLELRVIYSDDVPGRVAFIESRIPATEALPSLIEVMQIDGFST